MSIIARISAVLLVLAFAVLPSSGLQAAGTSSPPAPRGTPYFPPPTAPIQISGTAKVEAAQPPAAAASGKIQTTGLSSCFDYYKFNSTPVSISADLSSAIAGAPLGLSMSVKNENPYPIVDATVYVKVMRYGYARGEKNVNAPDVVDFFPASDPVTIPAGGQVNLKSVWQVPQDAEAGDYMLAAYVVSADRFEMEGLTFTDDVIGSAFNFKVVNDRTGAVSFDKNTATVLDLPFRFAAYPPRIPESAKEVPVGIDVVNTTNQAATQEVTWTLYKWDALRTSAVLDHKTERITVPAGGRVHVTYTTTEDTHSVYYLVGSLRTEGGSSSLVGIRFVRGDVNEPRLNYVGITAYPAAKGVAAFACVHSTGTAAAQNTKLELVATRPSFLGIGGTIAKNTYVGAAAGDIRALVAPFTADAKSFTVTARLFQNGALIDQVSATYNCADLAPGSCPKSLSLVPVLVGGGAGIAVLALLAYLFIRRRKAVPPAPPTPSVTPSI